MKRILCLLLVACIIIFSTLGVNAEEVQGNNGDPIFEGSSEIEHHVYSTFSVSIPMSISTEFGGEGMISVGMENVEHNKKIDISITNLDDGKLSVYNDYGDSGKLNVTMQDGTPINYDGKIASFDPQENTFQTVSIKLEEFETFTKSGVYHGSISYKIECKDK